MSETLLMNMTHITRHTCPNLSLVMSKPVFCIRENKDTDQLPSAFVFAIWIVQSLFYLNPKFQGSSRLLWLYSPVCVGPGRKPRRPVFSQQGSFDIHSKVKTKVSLFQLQGNEPRREKTGLLHMRKQRCRSAAQ